MKLTKIIVLLSCLFCQEGSAQDNQLADNTNARKISSAYHTIVVSSGITADIYEGNNDKVVVKASKADYRNKIKTVVVNDTLKVFFYYKDDPNWKPIIGSKEIFNVSIYASQINSIKITEGAVVNSHDLIQTDQLIVQLLKAGRINCRY
jgi:hypothetical protein